MATIEGLSSGSTLLNLACSDKSNVCYLPGHYYLFVGDSASGKTFLSLTCLAEASISKTFENHRLIYDNVEDGALMDFSKFFGKANIEPPAMDGEHPIYSATIEEFYYHLDDIADEGKPFIYVLDSMDSLSSEDEAGKFQDQKQAHYRGTKTAGSYGDGKAKRNSSGIRQILPKLKKTGSILIIIAQTRDNLGFGFEKKIRSGGRALRFYATLELWCSIREKIKKKIRGKDRQIGTLAQIQIKKNRLTGRERTLEVPIYHSFGVDDIGSCIDFLVDENYWKASKGTIDATDFDLAMKRDLLIAEIEKKKLYRKLQGLVSDLWSEIESECAVERMPRYG